MQPLRSNLLNSWNLPLSGLEIILREHFCVFTAISEPLPVQPEGGNIPDNGDVTLCYLAQPIAKQLLAHRHAHVVTQQYQTVREAVTRAARLSL